jgi:methionyl-tRNA formyltransferase
MRAVFCGTPDFAVPALNSMIGAEIDIPLVVSQPDRVRGRRGKPLPSPVRQCALDHELPTAVLEKGQRSSLYEQILGTKPDVIVVVAFGHIIREPLLNGTHLGCVNVHASLLPRWRGPAPIHTAIVAGDRETGVCTMKLGAGVDTGDVFECVRIGIGERETAGELHDRLASLGASTLLSTLEKLDRGVIEAVAQPTEGITRAPMLARAEGSVDFNRTAREVHDRIRGLDPWPATSVDWDGRRLKVSESEPVEVRHDASPGEVISVDNGLLVACADSAVRISRIQAEGKRPVSPGEFARGHGLKSGDRLRPVEGFVPREPRW